jgi:hypothetical protein
MTNSLGVAWPQPGTYCRLQQLQRVASREEYDLQHLRSFGSLHGETSQWHHECGFFPEIRLFGCVTSTCMAMQASASEEL